MSLNLGQLILESWMILIFIQLFVLTQVLCQGRLFPQPSTWDNVWDVLGCHKRDRGCYWHLVGRGQACCHVSHNARDSPTAKSDPVPNVGAQVEEPC